MKKSTTAIGVGAAAFFALGSACANTSSVTLYGLADIAFTHSSNKGGSSFNGLENGRFFASRVGFRGQEDLGGGLRAIFVMESGVDLDTGTSSSSAAFFNRQAWVGMSSAQWGALTLGRQTSPLFDNVAKFTGGPTFGINGAAVDGVALPGSAAGRFENTMSPPRFNNSIKYTSQRMEGFKVIGMYGFGEVAGEASAGQLQTVVVDYNKGPFDAAVGYFSKNCPNAGGCTADQGRDKVLALLGGYDFKLAHVGLVYTRQNHAKNVKDMNADVWTVRVLVPYGLWNFSAGYHLQNDRTVANQDVRQLNLGVSYDLSKRSTLYSFYSRQRVSNGGIASMGLMNSSNSKQNQLVAGIRHFF